jgi:hypothetical protein
MSKVSERQSDQQRIIAMAQIVTRIAGKSKALAVMVDICNSDSENQQGSIWIARSRGG